jgi:hypothetical protein
VEGVNGAVAPTAESREQHIGGKMKKNCSSFSTNLKSLSQIQGNIINNCDYVLVYNFRWGGRCEYQPGAQKATKTKKEKNYASGSHLFNLWCIY